MSGHRRLWSKNDRHLLRTLREDNIKVTIETLVVLFNDKVSKKGKRTKGSIKGQLKTMKKSERETGARNGTLTTVFLLICL